MERLTTGLGTTSRVGEIKPSFKVESVVIFHYLPTRSVTTYGTVKSELFRVIVKAQLNNRFISTRLINPLLRLLPSEETNQTQMIR